jgi:hypothetical protein
VRVAVAFNVVPPQRQADIRDKKKIIVCEHCGRVSPMLKECPSRFHLVGNRKNSFPLRGCSSGGLFFVPIIHRMVSELFPRKFFFRTMRVLLLVWVFVLGSKTGFRLPILNLPQTCNGRMLTFSN